jgi:glycosyltransferase 2 family protein
MKGRKWIQAGFALAVLALAVGTLVHLSRTMSWAGLHKAFANTPWSSMLIALAATVVSFSVLALYERYATQAVVPRRIPLGQSLSVGWMAHALSNTLGFHALTGGAVRYRAYKAHGLNAIDIGGIVTLVGISVGLGSGGLLAITMIIAPEDPWTHRVAGVVIGIALLATIWWLPATSGKKPFRKITIPRIRRTWLAQQLVLGLVEATAAALAFYILLPDGAVPSFTGLVPVLVIGVLIGIVSHSPGGLGVFEATVLAALPSVPGEEVLAALVLYRLIYNLLPCAAAIVVFSWQYFLRKRLANQPAPGET